MQHERLLPSTLRDLSLSGLLLVPGLFAFLRRVEQLLPDSGEVAYTITHISLGCHHHFPLVVTGVVHVVVCAS